MSVELIYENLRKSCDPGWWFQKTDCLIGETKPYNSTKDSEEPGFGEEWGEREHLT